MLFCSDDIVKCPGMAEAGMHLTERTFGLSLWSHNDEVVDGKVDHRTGGLGESKSDQVTGRMARYRVNRTVCERRTDDYAVEGQPRCQQSSAPSSRGVTPGKAIAKKTVQLGRERVREILCGGRKYTLMAQQAQYRVLERKAENPGGGELCHSPHGSVRA